MISYQIISAIVAASLLMLVYALPAIESVLAQKPGPPPPGQIPGEGKPPRNPPSCQPYCQVNPGGNNGGG